MEEEVIKKVKCFQCGWEWFPKSPKRPMFCANIKCHSLNWWNEEYVKKEKKEKSLKAKYNIGDLVKDEQNNDGIVVIKWSDGDLSAIENDAAHLNPKIVGHWKTEEKNG